MFLLLSHKKKTLLVPVLLTLPLFSVRPLLTSELIEVAKTANNKQVRCRSRAGGQ